MYQSSRRAKPLSCCEYINHKGDIAHVLGCCCDCDVIDSACDSCIRCQKPPEGFTSQMSTVLADRLRVPWLSGSGAIQLQIDVFLPIIIIPTLLILCISHYYVAWTLCIATPLALITYYRCWRRNTRRTRTRFFFSWSLVSIFTMAYVFFFCVCITYREVLLYEGMIVMTLFLCFLYTLYLVKQDPGSQRQNPLCDPYTRTVTIPNSSLSMKQSHQQQQKSGSVNGYHQKDMASLVNQTLDRIKRPNRTHKKSFSFGGEIALEVTEPPIQPSETKVKVRRKEIDDCECDICHISVPPRTSHCSICNECFAVRDHHCIWLDQCIGMRNHRAFIVLILLFLVISCYGLHLTLTTICTPIMVLDYFLLPSDCRFVYADLNGAVAYVSCCYTVVSIVMAIILFIQQFGLISQNITMQEFNAAIKERDVTDAREPWWRSFYILNNKYNRGFRSNWLAFIRRTRHEPNPIPPDTVD